MTNKLLDLVRAIFSNKVIDEGNREALTTFSVSGFDGTFTIYPPQFAFWLDACKAVFLQIIVTSFYAIIIYKVIIPNRKSVSARLLGFGILMPSALYFPYVVINFFGIINKVLRVGFLVVPFNIFFRTVEAMYGTSPAAVEDTQLNYILYLGSCIDFIWTTKGRAKVAPLEVLANISKFGITFLIASLSISFLRHFDYQPFQSNTIIDDFTLPDLGQLANNYFYAMMTCFTISVCMQLAVITNNIQGFSSATPFRNPLFQSKSPSDFWGRRWNLIIHEGLKRGIFKPVLKEGGSMWAAQLAAFLASGFFHEYIWSVLFYVTDADLDMSTGECLEGRCYEPKHGKPACFFIYCGMCLVVERAIGKKAPFQWMAKNIPLPIRSTLVVMTALPLAHWYTGDWIVGGYFEDHLMGLFKIAYTEA